ncbi:MAG: Uncharacterized protein G01um101416_823 [Microgenomates group bacterium Gr01-1014_16]|nr:MAG: Uncharacterized protein G01um101416_823 [Microgenomates group bacterium Gr01-1014_16]
MKKGFTFIELLLYLAIVGTIFSSLVPFAWEVIEGGARSAVDQEVDSSARFIMEKIKSKVRNAKSISIASLISMTITEQDLSTTTIDLLGGNIRLNAVNINSADTMVTDLVFTDFTSAVTKQVQIRFTIISSTGQGRQEYLQTVTLESSAEIRSI